jgi:nucleoside-diphosphate-sugar epimerase
VVVLAGGRSNGTAAELVDGHVTTAARAVDCFRAGGWPAGILVLASAAELLPQSVYGAIKRAQRELVAAACRDANVPCLALRLHSMVPRVRPGRGLFSELLAQYEAGGVVTVHHLGGARDYATADQLATVVATLVENPQAWSVPEPRLVEVGNGEPVRVSDWLRAFDRVFGAKATVRELAPGHPDPEIVADPEPLRQLLQRCAPGAWERYAEGHPVLEAMIQGWLG